MKCSLDLFSFQSNNVNDKTRKFDDVLSHCNQIIDVLHWCLHLVYVKIFVFSVISNWAINSYLTCQNSRNQNWIFGLLWLIFQPWLVQIATRFTIVFSYYVSSNISNMRHSVSSPDETPRRELKIRHVAEYFWRTSRCFIWWWNTVSNVWYFFSNKIIFEGEIKDANTEQFFIRFPNTH